MYASAMRTAPTRTTTGTTCGFAEATKSEQITRTATNDRLGKVAVNTPAPTMTRRTAAWTSVERPTDVAAREASLPPAGNEFAPDERISVAAGLKFRSQPRSKRHC